MPFGLTSFYVANGSYSNNTITTTFIQTATYNSRVQNLSLFQFYVTFFKGNSVWRSEIDQTPVPNIHINFQLITSFTPI